MLKQFLCQLFSGQCQLKSLRLDISNEFRDGFFHRCLSSNSNLSFDFIQYPYRSSCVTLRRLHIRLNQSCFLENLIEYVPNIEQMSIECDCSLSSYRLRTSNIETLSQLNENWFNKIPKLRCFSLKTFINNDSNIIYLKWLLNNINYVEKLELQLRSDKLIETRHQNILKSFIDASFIRQYCLPDTISNLIYFDFYICSECQLSFNDVERITNSFKIHSFFIDHQWTNVKCLFDPIMSSQHLFSSFNNTSQISDNFIDYSYIFNWPRIGDMWFKMYPSLYFFLEQFTELSPNISCVKIPDDLRMNALNTVRCAEFRLPSCHIGRSDVIHIGKHLVPFLSTYMPHLQTLRLWRPDDFPWTTIRPDYKERRYYEASVLQWRKSLKTPESIDQHVAVFEQDLCQLIGKLKDFIFLDIYGKIHYEKVEPYRSMVQARFPDSRIDVEISRFRLWR
ncbi:unnamed protein product [Rotaria sp. Silwood2]|nr:unnamed protein product [Rotaria sp. Silwood2]